MKTPVSFLVLAALVFFGGCARRETHRVVASLPAIGSILSDLTANTSITVVCPVPRDISLAEIAEFLDKHGPLLDSFSTCDAVVDIRSIIPQDAVYRALRSRSIRVIEIDCATSLDPDVTPVPVLKTADGNTVPYVWLSVTNCMKMAEIASKDLSRLYPSDSAAISGNLLAFKRRYFSLKSAYETKFSEKKDFEAAAMTRDFDYFLSDVNLFVAFRFPPDEASWSDGEKKDFAAQVRNGRIRTVVHRWKPSGPAGALLDSCGVATAVLCAGDPAMDSFEKGLYGLLDKNYSVLYGALKK
jgi:ABC-type Zn uptake system ZnuABC Zn-binding protein ZnuA